MVKKREPKNIDRINSHPTMRPTVNPTRHAAPPAAAPPPSPHPSGGGGGGLSRRVLILGGAAAATALPPTPPAAAFDIPTAPLAPPSPAVALYAAIQPATATVVDAALAASGGGVGAYADAAKGNGSGFVVDVEKGLVVTAAHVLQASLSKGATGAGLANPGPIVARVTLNGSGRALDGILIGASPSRDVALLRVPPAALAAALPLADADARPGDAVYAIGSAYGFAGSLTSGIVSAVGRAVPNPAAALVSGGGGGTVLPFCLQTDAATAPGSSGGPIVDEQGRVVGMAVAAFADASTNTIQKLTLAVPARSLARTVGALADGGAVPPPLGGVTLAPADVAAALAGSRAAVLIQSVAPGSPAEAAGLRGTSRGLKGVVAGDVITAPATPAGVAAALEGAARGEGVKLTVVRDGREEVVTVVM